MGGGNAGPTCIFSGAYGNTPFKDSWERCNAFLGFALQLACVQAIILLMLLLLQMFLVGSFSKFYVVKCLLLFLGKKRCPSHLAGFWYFPDRGNSMGFSKFKGKGLLCGFSQKMWGLEGAFKVYTFQFPPEEQFRSVSGPVIIKQGGVW